jgi:hypothetical protein
MSAIDRLIDDAARGMVTATPSPDFTARTMARIPVTARSRARWLLLPAGALAAVAAAAAVGALNQPAMGQLPLVPRPAPPSIVVARMPVVEPAIAPRRTAAIAAVVSAAERLWQERRLPALPAPAPIATEVIQPEALALPLLELKPLVTEPLAMEPIDGGK